MKCYKCKTENSAETIKCSSCGALLKFVCPKCKKVHPLKTLKCDCSYVFLKKCPECGALNKKKNEVCRKCGSGFNANIEKKSETNKETEIKNDTIGIKLIESQEVKQASSVFKIEIELVDFELIEKRLKKEEQSQKVLKFFYQIIAKNAKKLEVKARKKSTYVLLIKKESNEDIAALMKDVALAIEDDIKKFNEGLNKKIKTHFQYKMEVFEGNNSIYASELLIEEKILDETEIKEEITKEVSEKIEESIPAPVEENLQSDDNSEEKEVIEKAEEVKPEEKPLDNKVDEKEDKPSVEVENKEDISTLNITSKYNYDLISRNDLFEVFDKNIKESNSNFSLLLEFESSENPLILINNYISTIQDTKFIYLLGNCSNYTRNTAYGLFNDIFKSLLGLSYFNINPKETHGAIKGFLKDNFALDDDMVEFFTRFVLPNQEENIYNINNNKQNIYQAFDVLFSTLLENSKIVFAINNIKDLDRDSYELLVYLFNKSSYANDLNILMLKEIEESSLFEFDLDNLKLNPVSKYTLISMTQEESREYLYMLSRGKAILPIILEKEILAKAKGKSCFIEETFGLLIQQGALVPDKDNFKYTSTPVAIPDSYENLILERVGTLFKKSQEIYSLLILAALMGPKFNPIILNSILKYDEAKANEILGMLVAIGVFIPFDNFNLIFKNQSVFNNIRESLNEGIKVSFIQNVIDALSKTSVTDSSIYFELCLQTGANDSIIQNYASVEKELASRGAVYLLLKNYKKLLEIILAENIENKKELQYEIMQKAGVLSYESDPLTAIEYLPEIVNSYEEEEKFVEALDVAGYLTKSSILQGDYNLAIECINKALHYIEENEDKIIEKAFLNYIKLKPLFELGYYQEVISLAKNDILPILKTVLSKKEDYVISIDKIKEIILESEFFIAKGLTLQVNKEALEKLGEIDEKAKKESNAKVLCEQNLYLALYHVLTGSSNKAKKILIDLQGAVSSGQLDMKNVVLWRFITLLNNVFTGKIDAIQEEIENISIVANDFKMHFIEHSLSLINAKIENSEEILYEELNYFAENKIATGALFCWYFIAQKEIDKDAQKALSIAEQALDVCQRPEINNTYFEVLFTKLVAEAYLVQGDMDLAYVHIENALKLSKEHNIYALEATLYITFAKLFQERAASKEDVQESAQSANKLYIKAVELANEIKNDYILNSAQKDLKDFMTFCQLSQIEF